MWANYAIYEAIDKIPEICQHVSISKWKIWHYGASYDNVQL